MDTHQFDDMVRALGERESRRGALRLLVGGVIGIVTGGPVATTLAKREKPWN